jgi:hypothetical protein
MSIEFERERGCAPPQHPAACRRAYCCTPAGMVATFTQSVQKIPPASGLAMKHALASPVAVFTTHAMLAVLVPAVPAWTICQVPTGGFSCPAAGIDAARTRRAAATEIDLIGLSPFADVRRGA